MRKSEVLLSLALLGSTALSVWLWRELRAELTLNAALDAQLSARVGTAPAAASAAPEPAAPRPAPSTTPPPPAVSTSAADSTPIQSARVVHGTPEEWDAYRRRLMQDPKYREAWRAQERLSYNRRRENVIRLLGFTPEQADAVIDLEIERQLRAFDNPSPTPQTIEDIQRQQSLTEQQDREEQARLLELLGSDKRARFEEYMQTRGSRMQVDQFRAQLTGTEALRDDQVEPLIAALHLEQERMQQEMSDYRDRANSPGAAPDAFERHNEHEIEVRKAAYDRMHSAAAPILSIAQLEMLDSVLKRDLDRHEAQARIQRLQSKLDSGQAKAE